MNNILTMDKTALEALRVAEELRYKEYCGQGLKLDMSRGKPAKAQLNLSAGLLDALTAATRFDMAPDYRNYGLLDGIPEMKSIFCELLNLHPSEIIVGGNSSLNLMYDTLQRSMQFGVCGEVPLNKQGKIKWLCPVPGYDRHFAITELFGIEMLNVPMTKDGPDMDMIERLVAEDESIKGIWCVPKYSNPEGVVYSDETVKRFANLTPKAKDFRVFWDNAYMVHCVADKDVELADVFAEAKKVGKEDMFYMFGSTSKITYAGAGVAFIAASVKNIDSLKKLMTIQTIGPDKVNQYAHALYFKNADGIKAQMAKHAELVRPKFNKVLEILDEELSGSGIAEWLNPKGGYFISCNLLKGTAKATVKMALDAGVVFTPAGSAFPYKNDPNDTNVRLAPTLPNLEELEKAMRVFCICAKIAAANLLLSK